MKQTFKLYNDTVELVYDPEATRSRYSVEGVPIRGVNSLLSDILHKQGLLLWPLNEAMKHLFGAKWDDERKSYAYTLKTAHIKPQVPYTQEALEQLMLEAQGKHRQKADKSKDIGTIVHEAIQRYLDTGEVIEMIPAAQKPFDNFLDWFLSADYTLDWSERPVYSKEFGFAGRPDVLFDYKGKKILTDYKTSEPSPSGIRLGKQFTGIYPETYLQLAAYSLAYTEETGETVDDLQVVNVSKSGQIAVIKASDLGLTVTECQTAFRMGISLHNWLNKIKREKIDVPESNN